MLRARNGAPRVGVCEATWGGFRKGRLAGIGVDHSDGCAATEPKRASAGRVLCKFRGGSCVQL